MCVCCGTYGAGSDDRNAYTTTISVYAERGQRYCTVVEFSELKNILYTIYVTICVCGGVRPEGNVITTQRRRYVRIYYYNKRILYTAYPTEITIFELRLSRRLYNNIHHALAPCTRMRVRVLQGDSRDSSVARFSSISRILQKS